MGAFPATAGGHGARLDRAREALGSACDAGWDRTPRSVTPRERAGASRQERGPWRSRQTVGRLDHPKTL
eukprot:6723735-Lingulodinium_polyedra.AAC.1